jgi:hypothetical protein
MGPRDFHSFATAKNFFRKNAAGIESVSNNPHANITYTQSIS